MDKKIRSQIKFEIKQIDELFESYSVLFSHIHKRTPNLVEITAAASVLHSFYNGLENIFLTIAKGLDESVPLGEKWHRELLMQMADTNPKRGPVLNQETVQELAKYLAFRHYFRHSYSFFLDWKEMKVLVEPLEDEWKRIKDEVLEFLGKQIDL